MQGTTRLAKYECEDARSFEYQSTRVVVEFILIHAFVSGHSLEKSIAGEGRPARKLAYMKLWVSADYGHH